MEHSEFVKSLCPDYQLVWNDEFEGDSVDPTKWQPGDDMGQAIPNSMTERNVIVKDSCVHLISQREGDNDYSIASTFSTLKTMAYQYGYVEMRAKVPYELGVWAAFWAKSSPNYQTARYCLEVDIMEQMGKRDHYCSSVHKWGSNHSSASIPFANEDEGWKDRSYYFTEEEANEFHTYGYDWTPERVAFYCDGNCFFHYDIKEENDYGEGELAGQDGFHDPIYLIFNNHLFWEGKIWWVPSPKSVNAVNPRTPMPKTMIVDYVRLYQKPGLGELIKPGSNRFP